MVSVTNPNQIALITTRLKDEDNILTVAWHMRTSFVPELFAISIGKKRHSHELIEKSKCFCVNFISHSLEKHALLLGSKSGRNTNKFNEAKLEKIECSIINCPRLKDALAYMECKVVDKLDTGDHTIFIGEVLKSEALKKDKRLFQLEGSKFTTTVD